MIHLSDYTPPAWPSYVGARKLAFIDCETTGLDPAQCDLIEVAVVSEDGLPFECKLAISEHDEQRADNADAGMRKRTGKGWREVNGYTREAWADAPQPSHAVPMICDAIAGKILVGHNLEFDLGFLRSAMERLGISPRAVLSPTTIDTLPLAKSCLPDLENYKLSTICERLGIEPEGVHRAMGGAVRAKLVYEKLTEAARKGLTT